MSNRNFSSLSVLCGARAEARLLSTAGQVRSWSPPRVCLSPSDLLSGNKQALRTTTCFGMTIASLPMSCRSSPTSCATPTCAPHAPCPSDARLLCSPGGLPGQVPPGGQRTRQVSGTPLLPGAVSAAGFGSCFSQREVDTVGSPIAGADCDADARKPASSPPLAGCWPSCWGLVWSSLAIRVLPRDALKAALSLSLSPFPHPCSAEGSHTSGQSNGPETTRRCKGRAGPPGHAAHHVLCLTCFSVYDCVPSGIHTRPATSDQQMPSPSVTASIEHDTSSILVDSPFSKCLPSRFQTWILNCRPV